MHKHCSGSSSSVNCAVKERKKKKDLISECTVASSSSFCEATAIIMLIILSLWLGWLKPSKCHLKMSPEHFIIAAV